VATAARDFLANQTPAVAARIVEFVICPTSGTPAATPTSNVSVSANGNGASATSSSVIELQILLFNKDNWAFAKAFWQHTGDGISSRRAERALAYLGETPAGQEAITPTSAGEQGAAVGAKNTAYYSKNRHYARRANSAASGITAPSPSTPVFLPTPSRPNPPTTTETIEENDLTVDLTTYLEERYGRNLPLFNAPLAKQALKRRIAGGLLPSDEDYGKIADVERGGGQGKKSLTADDIYLYPTGMSAIWHAHDVARVARRRTGAEGKSVCYGCVIHIFCDCCVRQTAHGQVPIHRYPQNLAKVGRRMPFPR
jgi:cystathionine gamma-synthase